MQRSRYGGACRYQQTPGLPLGAGTGFHPYTLEPIFSAKTQREKLAQRQFFFWYKPEERKNIINELRRIGRQDLIDKLYGKKK